MPRFTCYACKGQKWVSCQDCDGGNRPLRYKCETCNGTGKETCYQCKGTGVVEYHYFVNGKDVCPNCKNANTKAAKYGANDDPLCSYCENGSEYLPSAPSSTSSYTPPPSSATSKPAAPVAPKSAAPASNVWQLKAPAYGSVFRQYKYYGEYVKKGQDVLEFCKESGGDVNLKSEVDGYITNELKSNLNVNAGTVLIEITPGKKKGLFG